MRTHSFHKLPASILYIEVVSARPTELFCISWAPSTCRVQRQGTEQTPRHSRGGYDFLCLCRRPGTISTVYSCNRATNSLLDTVGEPSQSKVLGVNHEFQLTRLTRCRCLNLQATSFLVSGTPQYHTNYVQMTEMLFYFLLDFSAVHPCLLVAFLHARVIWSPYLWLSSSSWALPCLSLVHCC